MRLVSLANLRSWILAGALVAPATGPLDVIGRDARAQPVAACDDPLVELRRTNLPNVLPWPVDFFQPQAWVRGADKPEWLPKPERKTLSLSALEKIEQYAEENGTLALLIQKEGHLEFAWYARGFDETSPIHTYHMHYTPVVLLTGIAIEQGHIESVDDPVAKYIEEWKGTPKEEITVRNLLQMHSGLELRRDAHYSEGMFSRDACAYWGGHTKDNIINSYDVIAPPGKKFDYNYIVPELLGVVIERATGRKYENYLSENLWQPLGNHTGRVWLNREGGEAHQDAVLIAGPGDWLRIGQMMVDGGRYDGKQIVPEDWIDLMMQPSPTQPNFGMMWRGSPYQPARRLTDDERVTYTVMASEPFFTDDLVYISGYGGQRVYISPSEELVVVHLGTVNRAFDNAAVPNMVGGSND